MSMILKGNSGINFKVDTVDDLLTLEGSEGEVVIVSDENRGGTFVYRSAEVDTNDGGTMFNGWCRQYDGAVNVKWFGAVGDGVTDDTAAIQAAIDSLDSLVCGTINIPIGTYKITSTLIIPNRGIDFIGASMRQTIIENSTTSDPLLQIGDASANQHAQFSGIFNISFVGNALSTAGVELLGIIDDSLSDASKVCSVDRIRITGIDAGYALRVSSWNNNFGLIEIEDCLYGLNIGEECNAVSFENLRITACVRSGIYETITSTANTSSVNFSQTVVQQSGSTTYPAIKLTKGRGYNFNNLYLEDNTGTNVIYIDGITGGFVVGCWTYAHSGDAAQNIFRIGGESTATIGTGGCFGNVNSHVLIEGASTKTFVMPTLQQTGSTTTGRVVDNSTNKLTVTIQGINDGVDSNRLVINQTGTSSGAVIVKTGSTEHLRITAGGFIQWTDTGHAIENGSQWFDFKRSGSYTETRQSIARLTDGTNSVVWRQGSGSPEGAVFGNPGSIYSDYTNGKLYIKESGTGNTGWVAK